MKPEEKDFETPLDKAIREVASTEMERDAATGAANRVWTRLAAELQPAGHRPPHVEHIRSCADFQALIPEYRAGKLTPARAMLFEDHKSECVACRKAFEAARPKVVPITQTPPRRFAFVTRPQFRWALAAMLLIAAGLGGLRLFDMFGPAPGGSSGVVYAAEGKLYRVSDWELREVIAGEQLAAGSELRTAKDASAMVELRDGSRVEMRERSEFKINETREEVTIELDRGSIIVEAAKRRKGRLSVQTKDCKVSVTGTVFSVSASALGSRVAVVEGRVRVARSGEEKYLGPGEQYSSSGSLAPVPVADEIAWSRNFDKHLALLKELNALSKKLEDVRMPGLRYSSRLLDWLPAETVLFVSIPNLGQTLGEAQEVVRRKTEESPILREWYQQQLESGKGPKFSEVIEALRGFSEYLGDEIVIAASAGPGGRVESPVFLAEVRRNGLREYMEQSIKRMGAKDGTGFRFVEDVTGAPAIPGKEMLVLLRPNLMAFSPEPKALAATMASIDGKSGATFAGTPMHARLAESYRGGTGFLFSADVEKLMAMSARGGQKSAPGALGNVKSIIVEQKDSGGKTDTRANVFFAGARQGVASWLAKPAAIGGLDFVSPEAGAASAFVLKNPQVVLDDLFAMLSASSPKFPQELAQLEAELGFRIKEDLGAALGGELTFAFDGPPFPVPSWKLVLEVYDRAKLQSSIEKIVAVMNRASAAHGKPGPQLTQEAEAGRTYYKIAVTGLGPLAELQYVYVDGYLLAAPTRVLINNALQNRSTGYTLIRSTAFQALLPRTGQSQFSGMVYQNFGTALKPLAEGVSATGLLSPEQKKVVQQLADDAKPAVVLVYGGDDRITVAASGSLIGMGLNNLLGMQGPMALAHILEGKARGTLKKPPAYK